MFKGYWGSAAWQAAEDERRARLTPEFDCYSAFAWVFSFSND